MTDENRPQPLSGIRVIDFSTLLPGPLASLILAEAGAEVIRIERPGGEDMRHYPPDWDGMSATFALLNRGKASCTIDLKTATGRTRLDKLLASADVLLEQFRPGVMKRLGLDYESLRQRHEKLVYCSISGYGQSGPKAGQAGHDLNYMGDAGVLALAPGPDGAPVVPPVLAADIGGGSYPAVINILLALRQRDRNGKGCHIDIAMTENLFPFAFWALASGQAGAGWPRAGQGLLGGGSPRYHLYPAACGRLVAVAALEEKFWRRFCDLIDLPAELRPAAADPEPVIEAIAARIAAHPAGHWRPVLEHADCCCTIVATLEEAVTDPHFAARGVFAHRLVNARGSLMPALPVPVAAPFRTSAEASLSAPELEDK
jgi:crotonobetainyl-CoA:carnitine CoA-transferase CaiB-like acyl-CoA transferase